MTITRILETTLRLEGKKKAGLEAPQADSTSVSASPGSAPSGWFVRRM